MKISENTEFDSYRTSHTSPGHGEHYATTYEHGYYASQWRLIERPLLRSLFAELKHSDKIRYLDFACGTGRILGVAEEFFGDTTGVDISPEMLRVASRNCKSSELIRQDITRRPLEKEYDVITAFRFFLNAEPALADEVLRALHGLLAETGKLFANIHVNKKSPLGAVYELRNMVSGRTIANTKSYASFKELLERNNFHIEEVIWYSVFPRFGWKFATVTNYLMGPSERLLSLLPFCSGFAQCYLVKCRRK